MSEIRQPGWYWAMHAAFDDPQVVQYCPSDGFMIAGISGAFDEDSFESIGPRIPTPDEPWQTVPAEATAEMCDGFRRAEHIYEQGVGEQPGTHWRFMLAAAPRP